MKSEDLKQVQSVTVSSLSAAAAREVVSALLAGCGQPFVCQEASSVINCFCHTD